MKGTYFKSMDARHAIAAPIRFSEMYRIPSEDILFIKLRRKAINKMDTPITPTQSVMFI
jgi:hypothetical protein